MTTALDSRFCRSEGSYVKYYGERVRGHPLAAGTARPSIARHRVVCWESAGEPDVYEARTPCWMCGYLLPWRLRDMGAVPGLNRVAFRYVVNVDHLNGIRGDDRPENLAPACWWCNSNRLWLSEICPDWQGFLRAQRDVDPNSRSDLRRVVEIWNGQGMEGF